MSNQREILFRGKHQSGVWLHGGFFKHRNGKSYIVEGDGGTREILPETLGQYTGLNDKNGARIFEGDIYQPMQGPRFIIKYVDAEFVGYNGVSMPALSTIHHGYREKGVVVGNIHDNPELVKNPPGIIE